MRVYHYESEVTLTIDEELLPEVKRYARLEGVSLSALVETSLRKAIRINRDSFSSRWRGQFKPNDQKDTRYEQLAKKYL